MTDDDFSELLDAELQRDSALREILFGSSIGWTRVPTVVPHADPLKVQLGSGSLVSNSYTTRTESAGITVGESTHGSYIGPTLPTQSGYARVVVIAALLRTYNRSTRVDDNGVEQPFDQVIAVEYRTYAGSTALLGSEVPPDSDLALALSQGVVALAAVRLVAGQPQVTQSDISYCYPTPLCAESLQVGAGGLDFGIVRTDVEGNASLLPSVAVVSYPGTGGLVRLSSPHLIVVDHKTLMSTWGDPTGVWSSPTLDTSTTYFMRAQLTSKGTLNIYVQKGTVPVGAGVPAYTYPGTLKGTPNAGSGGEFPSTFRDILIAKVTTGVAGSLPVVTPYYQGELDLVSTKAGDYSITPVLDQSISLPAPCARDLLIDISVTNEWVTTTPPDVSYITAEAVTATVTGWSTESVRFNAKGRWVQDNGMGLLKKTSVTFRPGVRLTIRTVRSRTVGV